MEPGKEPAKKKCVRKFRRSWLDENVFKGWLAPSEDNKAFCKICNVSIKCARYNLLRHAEAASHVENLNCSANLEVDSSTEEIFSHTDKVQRAEIKIAAFFAEHNVALSTVDHLVPLIKDLCLNPEVVQDIALGRTKCTQIVKNVIARREMEKIVQNLKTCKFSILIDESTDISDTKFLCILVKYVSPINKKVTTQLFALLPLDATNCSADNLYETFKKCFAEFQIPLENLVGMASDNASVMIGNKNSLFTKLQVDVPRLISLNCICHSSALIASKATEKLPRSCESLIRGIVTYISGSAKRSTILREFQDFFEVEKNKLLKFSKTRWLVLHECIVRLLDNWQPLIHFFILAVSEDKLESAEIILNQFNDSSNKAYLLFLKYALNFFNSFNALFQSRNILIHKLFKNSQQLITQMSDNFMTSEAIDEILFLNPDSDEQLKSLDAVYLGPLCETFLLNEPQERVIEIRQNCLEFYKTAVREMIKRLPYKDKFFEHLSFLDPKIAFSSKARETFKDLSVVATRLGDFDISQLAFEWRLLPRAFTAEEKESLTFLNIDEMWDKILECEDCNGNKSFPNLAKLVEAVLVLPHSNAEAERIFSILTDVKNKKRNSLGDDTLSAICIIRSSFQIDNINCSNFESDSRHIELHNASNLYKTG